MVNLNWDGATDYALGIDRTKVPKVCERCKDESNGWPQEKRDGVWICPTCAVVEDEHNNNLERCRRVQESE